MNKRTGLMLAMALAVALTLSGARAQSEDPKNAGGKANAGSIYDSGTDNPYIDRVARNEGDILQVIITEDSAATFAASTQTSKGDNNSVSADLFKNFLSRLFGPLASNASSTTSGSGSTTQTNRMNARLSVMVREVMPGGLLRIEGRRSLVTNKQTQTFVLGGLVRRQDIAPDNTVPSSKIAEAEIRMEGAGAIQERQRKGVITQLMDWLF